MSENKYLDSIGAKHIVARIKELISESNSSVTIKTMPIMTGVYGYFTPILLRSDGWLNAMDPLNAIRFTKEPAVSYECVDFSPGNFGVFDKNLSEVPYPKTVYMVLKVENVAVAPHTQYAYIFTANAGSNTGNYCFGQYSSGRVTMASSGGTNDVTVLTTGEYDNYICVALQVEVNPDLPNSATVYIFVNGNKVAVNISTMTYSGSSLRMGVNTKDETGKGSYAYTSFKHIAISSEMHTDEEIIENSQWLMAQYGVL